MQNEKKNKDYTNKFDIDLSKGLQMEETLKEFFEGKRIEVQPPNVERVNKLLDEFVISFDKTIEERDNAKREEE